MRKIPSALENPIDDVLIRMADMMAPGLKATGHTPDVITTYSFLAAMLSLAALSRGNTVAFAVLWMSQYFFDCADGHFARKYGMVTRFGDLYDHATDYIAFAGLAFLIHDRYDMNKIHPVFFVFFAVTGVLNVVHIGCQQKVYGGSGESLDVAKGACVDTSWLKFTRFFGVGTVNVALVLAVVYFEKYCLKESKKLR